MAAAVALLYAMFALVVLRALMVGLPSCGCFGQTAAPPSLIHVVGNLVLSGVSVAAAIVGESPVDAFAAVMTAQPAVAAVGVFVTCILAGLVFVTFTALPEALQAGAAAGRTSGSFRMEPGHVGDALPTEVTESGSFRMEPGLLRQRTLSMPDYGATSDYGATPDDGATSDDGGRE